MGTKLKHPPKIYHVNWFRRDGAGKFLWPGFGDNLRVLAWILDRCTGRANARETAIGNLPQASDLHLEGLEIAEAALEEFLSVNAEEWRSEAADLEKYLDEFAARTPQALRAEVKALQQRLG
jgi:phosphoenolpyruvate carboxykinase (GTP)